MSKGINKNTHKLSGVYEIRNTLNNKRYIERNLYYSTLKMAILLQSIVLKKKLRY